MGKNKIQLYAIYMRLTSCFRIQIDKVKSWKKEMPCNLKPKEIKGSNIYISQNRL